MSADRIPPRTPAGAPKEGAFGDDLRRAREARGLTLQAIADATRIARRHLDALERGDLDALPAGPFAKGYIEAYANALGIDAEPLVRSYRERERERGKGGAERQQRMLQEMSALLGQRTPAKQGPRLRVWRAKLALAVAGLLVLAGLGWGLARARRPAPAATSPPSAERRETPAAVASGGRQPVAPRARGPAARAASPAAPGAAAKAAPAPAPTVVPPTESLEVTEHGVGSDIVDHRLVGRSDRFAEGTTVAFWTLVAGGQPGNVIRHVWFQNGRAVVKAELRIGGRQWRTFSRLQLPRGSAGRWTVEARASDGRLLARDEFLCVSAAG